LLHRAYSTDGMAIRNFDALNVFEMLAEEVVRLTYTILNSVYFSYVKYKLPRRDIYITMFDEGDS
jgi:hypothetical protein